MRTSAWTNRAYVVTLLLLAALGCRQDRAESNSASGTQDRRNQTEPHGLAKSDKPFFVMFDLKPEGKQSDTTWLYSCTYAKAGATARFQVAFQVEPKAGQYGIRSGRGSFIAIKGSDPSVLLSDLKNALDATHMPGTKVRVHELPFEVAILGEHQHRDDDGSFVDADDGTWISSKLFLHGGEYEVFFNFEPAGGKGEFSMKDSDYGDGVLTELAKAL